jgi:hypothetical protein
MAFIKRANANKSFSTEKDEQNSMANAGYSYFKILLVVYPRVAVNFFI